MGVPAKVTYSTLHDKWFAWEGPFWRRFFDMGELGSGRTPDEAYQDLLRAVERRSRMKTGRRSPVYFDADGTRRGRP